MSETPIGERLGSIENTIKNVAERQEDMKKDNAARHLELKTEISDIKKDFVSKIEFTPVKLITYGFVTIILSAVLFAIANSFIHVIK